MKCFKKRCHWCKERKDINELWKIDMCKWYGCTSVKDVMIK